MVVKYGLSCKFERQVLLVMESELGAGIRQDRILHQTNATTKQEPDISVDLIAQNLAPRVKFGRIFLNTVNIMTRESFSFWHDRRGKNYVNSGFAISVSLRLLCFSVGICDAFVLNNAFHITTVIEAHTPVLYVRTYSRRGPRFSMLTSNSRLFGSRR